MPASWQEIVADKRKRQQDTIPKEWIVTLPAEDVLDVTNFPIECGLLTEKEIEITELTDIVALLKKLAEGEWTSVEVTTAYSKRAIVAHQVTNCLTEIFVDKALARAKWLDEQLKTTGKVVGPLHGLPISLKDQIALEGLETIMGYVSWVGKPAAKNAVVADILYECGAVPYVRTNVPQTLMWSETYNTVFGRTVNPRNRTLTCGGSSGGEGALIAMKGSILGVGSDIGGSVRIPAAMNGLYGLRPSYHRIPYAGAVNSLEGQDSLPSVLGPLSPSLAGVKLFMEAVISKQPWFKDPLVIHKPWNEEEYKLAEHGGGKKLCFGILWDDGVLLPHPPVIRALEMTKKALLDAGHDVVDWKPHKHQELYDSILDIWTAAGVDDYEAVTKLTGEPLLQSMAPDAPLDAKALYHDSKTKTVYELFQIQKKRRDLRQEYLELWRGSVKDTTTGRPVDAIISPVAPWAPPPHGKNSSAQYTMIWNCLDYPACTFPVTTVDETLDKPKPAHNFYNERDQQCYELYDSPTTFKNAPVSLQLVGHTLEEEAVVGMTEVVDAALKAQSKA
ncbi:general amidase [Stereum hirsutum FP-91666 SS1]|uniref:general amidase n=1 Tax=Stereum hirsutum (strain FP-91666) TaxID=721885 RepID=UPI000440DE0B|nr:general amidase [Stereum hirsutum FP-91666 SS1]EIM92443.1 general amidase [Stereum hirsutum FP-91666 SS1]